MTNDQIIGQKLLKKDSDPPEGQTESVDFTASLIIRRTEKRFCLLWILAGSLWVLTAVFFILAVHGFFMYIFPLLVEWIQQVQSVNNQPRISNLAGVTAMLCLYSVYICSILFLLSAISTIILIVFSRRATLRQIQVQLAGISEQLGQLSRVSSGSEGEV